MYSTMDLFIIIIERIILSSVFEAQPVLAPLVFAIITMKLEILPVKLGVLFLHYFVMNGIIFGSQGFFDFLLTLILTAAAVGV